MVRRNDDIFERAKVAHFIVGCFDKAIDMRGTLTPATSISIQTGPAVIVNVTFANVAYIVLRQVALNPEMRLVINDRLAHLVSAYIDRFALALEHFVGRLNA